MRLVSIQTGKPRDLGTPGAAEPFDRPWTTGYGKQPVAGAMVRTLNLDGDGQADKRHHGGPDMAVLAYSADHYVAWRKELDWGNIPSGAFAENLTVEGATEDTVCIGDVWEIGEVRLQVSEPRKPCNNISRFWHKKELLKQVEEHGRYGWYLRVLREGRIEAGQGVTLVSRAHPEWTVAKAMRARREKAKLPEGARALAALPELGEDWRRILLAR
ncbi:MAG: MOSC domain-containing protein [Deltaproteobacteria bacterium]|nr:MOSC domain-containing protein [Deltaproteobacteria bacterium]